MTIKTKPVFVTSISGPTVGLGGGISHEMPKMQRHERNTLHDHRHGIRYENMPMVQRHW